MADTVLEPVTNRGLSKHFTETRRLWTSVAGWNDERKYNFYYSSEAFLAGRWFQHERRFPTTGYHNYLYENYHQCQSKHNVTSKNNRWNHLWLHKLSRACHETRIVMTEQAFNNHSRNLQAYSSFSLVNSFKSYENTVHIDATLHQNTKFENKMHHSKISELWHSTFQQWSWYSSSIPES